MINCEGMRRREVFVHGVSGTFHRVNSTVGRILFLDIYTTTLLLEVVTQRTLKLNKDCLYLFLS
jgi:hypothetical protein